MIRTLLLAVCVIFFAGCERYDAPPKEVEGYVPLYEEKINTPVIAFQDARPIENAGKIYTKGNLLYQVDNGKGIHVISISNPAQPEKLGFIPVAGAQEISILHNNLYTNNGNDLIVIDITATRDPEVVSKIGNAFSLVNHDLPPERGYFECADPSKGIVKGWTKKIIQSPKCKY
ncbi:MAG: hypothetical protein KIT80_06075 [Chitinophagaceae bacterium]|nr:hypothetical protein [Chitinophagaceae bacterium]MCW5926461.1 hypothetical protein [Chitinophagaceae bacterium]